MGMDPVTMGIASGALAGGGSIASALINKSAAGEATAASLEGTRESIAAQKDQAAQAAALYTKYADQARTDLQPFRDAQLQATQALQGFTDPNNPIYQQQRDLSTQAIQRQLAAQGLLRSSGQSSQLQQLELGLNQQRLGVLGGLAGNGAAQGTSSISQNLGGGLAQIYGGLGQGLGSSFQQGGQAAAQGILGQAQAIAGGVTGFGNAIQGTIGNISSFQLLQKLMAGRTGGV